MPTFIWHTYDDELIPAEQATAYATALSKHAIPFEMHIFEKGIHGLSLATAATAATAYGDTNYIDDDAAQWLGLCERWLLKRM